MAHLHAGRHAHEIGFQPTRLGWIASPTGKYTVAAYCESRGLEYSDRVGPLTRERFLDYADWYIEQLVPGVQDETVAEVTPVDGGFRVSFADAAPVTARQVVVATGVIPYHYLPAELAALPSRVGHAHRGSSAGRISTSSRAAR